MRFIWQYTQAQVREVERRNDTPEKLAVGLLLLLFSPKELAAGNCTKPIRDDITELDSDKVWAIKCKCNSQLYLSINYTQSRSNFLSISECVVNSSVASSQRVVIPYVDGPHKTLP